jgi:hypothetical protein
VDDSIVNGFQWKPIQALSDSDLSIDLSELESVQSAWAEAHNKLKESSPENLKAFNERLARYWSIETGILERLYDIDRGTTLLLIEHGFVVDYVDRAATNKEPEELIQILRDHKAAADLLQDCVADNRPLTIGLIHELHSTLTRHQDTVEALDQFKKHVRVPLLKGAFKKSPNNPQREDGGMHEYCPPLHVAAEMDELLRLYATYSAINPLLLATWLHHRFTQIHPYQDGNGRVARAISNLVLIKAGIFPIVVSREIRPKYIENLEKADAGDLVPLSAFFAEIEKQTIVEALSVGPDRHIPKTNVVAAVGGSIAQRLKKRKEETEQRLRSVNKVAEVLQKALEAHLKSLVVGVRDDLNTNGGLHLGSQILLGGPNIAHGGKPTDHWYRFQVIQAVEGHRHFINFDENKYFVRARLSQESLAWLTFVVAFHHVGHELSGLMSAVAFAEFQHPGDDNVQPELVKCMDRPLTFSHEDNAEKVKQRLFEWAEECFAIAISKWGNLL